MCLLQKAKWISYQNAPVLIGDRRAEEKTTAQLMRREFMLQKPVRKATLSISGLGYCVAYTNGERVSDTVLNPAFTDYTKSVMYNVYDIGNLCVGVNCIAVSLGDGFYNATTEDVWNFVNATWRDHSRLALALEIVYADGETEALLSDTRFRGIQGPVVFNAVRNGTTYDARLAPDGWTQPGFDDNGWNQAVVVNAAPGVLKEQTHLPIRVMAEYACEVNKISPKLWVFDAGVNTAGRAKIALTAHRGAVVRMQYGERLHADGTLDVSKIAGFCRSGAFQTDTYIACGIGREEFCGEFAYHGFRYISVTCEDGIPADFTLVAQEMRSAMTARGGFTCSDDMLNAIQRAATQATKTNMHGMPTDCPHREKNGWTGDAQLSAEQTLLNFNPMSIYNKWMGDFIDAQLPSGQLPGIVPTPGWGYTWGSGPAWDSAIVEIPYMQYLYCGDRDILAQMYAPIKKYIGYMDRMAENGICCFGLGDWCAPKSNTVACDNALTDTAYYYYDTRRTAEIAKILGHSPEAAVYAEKAAGIKAAFRKRFIADGKAARLTVPHCQTAFGCILYQGLAEADEKEAFANALVAQVEADGRKTTCGILGAKYVYNTLCRFGRADLVYALVSTPEYPSLGYMLAQNATTLWEDYEGSESLNHHMYGDISAVFYKYFAGIQPCAERPGFRHTRFAPQFAAPLSHAEAWHESPFGKVSIAWERRSDCIAIETSVPQGCTADITLPSGFRLTAREHELKPGVTRLVAQACM